MLLHLLVESKIQFRTVIFYKQVKCLPVLRAPVCFLSLIKLKLQTQNLIIYRQQKDHKDQEQEYRVTLNTPLIAHDDELSDSIS